MPAPVIAAAHLRTRPPRLVQVAGAAGLALLLLTVLVAARAPVPLRADAALSAAAGRFTEAHGWCRAAMTALTHSGDAIVLRVVFILGVAGLAAARRWRAALFAAAVGLLGIAARLTLLYAVARPRPEHRLVEAHGYSFPSGHTTSSALTAGVVVAVGLVVLRPGVPRRVFFGLALGWAVLVGLSRVMLVVHWPTDVLGGWLLATTVLAALSWGFSIPSGTAGKAAPHAPADPAPGGERGGPGGL